MPNSDARAGDIYPAFLQPDLVPDRKLPALNRSLHTPQPGPLPLLDCAVAALLLLHSWLQSITQPRARKECVAQTDTKFVSEMLYGIQSSQDVKLSNIGRALGEAIPLIRTEKRLSRNLKHAEIEAKLTSTLASMASRRICEDTVLALDLSDIRKEYVRRMEHLATVWDGSTGETHPGYWLVDVTGAEVDGSDIVPVCQKLFSTQAKEFRSENAEILSVVDEANRHLNGRGIWTMDRGCDRKKLLEPLLDKHLRFVIRSTGGRMVRDWRGRLRGIAEVAAGCRLRHQARVVKIDKGQEKTYELDYGAEPFRLVGRDEPLWLAVVAGLGEQPILLVTNLTLRALDSESVWWATRVYWTRWKIEETFRFVKQSYNLEDIRGMKYRRLMNLVVVVTAAAYVRCHLSRPENEAAHPHREAACHLAAILRHSALPLLCFGRRNPTPSVRQRLPAKAKITAGRTTGTGTHLPRLKNCGESPGVLPFIKLTVLWARCCPRPQLPAP